MRHDFCNYCCYVSRGEPGNEANGFLDIKVDFWISGFSKISAFRLNFCYLLFWRYSKIYSRAINEPHSSKPRLTQYNITGTSLLRSALCVPWLSYKIAVPISRSPQRSWWGLILAETRPARWVTLPRPIFLGRCGSLVVHTYTSEVKGRDHMVATINWPPFDIWERSVEHLAVVCCKYTRMYGVKITTHE